MILTEDQINQLKHIPDEEVKKDISDTQKEIDQFEKELVVLKENMQGNKLPIYMTEGKISIRNGLIKQLNQVLEHRNSKNEN